uniref:Uncharacterized protein n=1 Tax=Siphoviridae sp. ctWhx86 TaxID=2826362 RepID=A0A8S5QQD3_9CAUD|nr:MAG TPA: hypothetical protein [Siphoviridae sp. ctWhx86]
MFYLSYNLILFLLLSNLLIFSKLLNLLCFHLKIFHILLKCCHPNF